MTLEDQIAALCAEAEPLRCLPDDEAEAKGLPALVERINLLRGLQMTSRAGLHQALTDKAEAEFQALVQEMSLPVDGSTSLAIEVAESAAADRGAVLVEGETVRVGTDTPHPDTALIAEKLTAQAKRRGRPPKPKADA